MNTFLFYSLVTAEVVLVVVGLFIFYVAFHFACNIARELSASPNNSLYSPGDQNLGKDIRRVCAISIVALMCLAPPFLTESVRGGTFFTSADGTIRRAFSKPVFLWQKDYDALFLGAARRYNYQGTVLPAKVTLSSSPITDNPKVRRLNYTVGIEAVETPEAYLKSYAALTSFGAKWAYATDRLMRPLALETSEFLRFHLYELNERRSKKLADFYNPLDPKQQSEFRSLIRNELGTVLLGAGLRVVSAQFDLEQ